MILKDADIQTRTARQTPPPPGTLPQRQTLYDPFIILIVGVLMTLGAVMVYSATVTVTGAPFDWRQWWNTPLRQVGFAALGFFAMLVAAHVDYRVLAWEGRFGGWRAGILAVLALAFLVAVLVPGVGKHVLGARRAIYIPGLPVGFQPSEFAKVIVVIWLAALLTRPLGRIVSRRARYPLVRGAPAESAYPAGDIRDLSSGFVPAVLSTGLLVALTAVEDFGTAALMGVIMLILLLVAGARLVHLALLGVLGLLAGVGLIIVEPYRLKRIATFFADNPDTSGAGYQITQALLAIGSGGWWGRGLGAGVQKYGYLPQDNNDFILAIICEELGIVGGLFVVVLFLLLLWRGTHIAAKAPDRFGQFLALGLTLLICLQAAFNIGVVTNSIPTKGISLPFVSAGGSGVVFLGIAAGLLAAIGRRRHASAQTP